MTAVTDVYVNGVRSAVRDSGPRGRGEAVVFVHGNPGPMDDWDTLMPKASEFARVIAMDMPGYGRADRPRSFEYTVDGYVRHLGGLLDQLEVKRAHLVLHDFGGPWGLVWAAAHRDAVASLTLVNTGVLLGYKWHKLARAWQTPILGELFQLTGTAKVLHAALNQDNPKPMPRSFVDRVMKYSDWGHKSAVLKLYRATKDPEARFRPIVEQLATLDVPVCVVWGEGDKYLPAEFAEKQRQFFKRAEVHVLPGLGHWPFIDDPAAVEQVVVPFLRRFVTPA